MILIKTAFAFARNVRRPFKATLKTENKEEPQVEEEKKKVYEKKFTKDEGFLNASNHLQATQLPQAILQKARKVFNKYDPEDLRSASYKYMRMYQLLHAIEKPSSITIKKNILFENPSNLKNIPETDNVIHLRGKSTKEEEILKNVQARRETKDAAVDRLQEAEKKTEDYHALQPLLEYDQTKVVSYLLRKVPGSYAAGLRILKELKKRNPTFKPKTHLDFGSGVGPWAWSSKEVFPELDTIACVEPSLYMRKLARYLNQENKVIRLMDSLSHTLELSFEEFDLVTIAFVLEEIAQPQGRILALQSLWAKLSENGFMVLACPGSPTGFRFVNDFREWVLSQKGHIVAPCQHQGACPLAKEGFQWCHFDQSYYQWPKDVFPKHVQENRVLTEKFSYLVVSKKKLQQVGQNWSRIIFPVMKRGQHNIVDVCTETGEFERRVIGKSAGKDGGYYEAKHLRWGDLWRFKKPLPSRVVKKRRKNKVIKTI